jgi:hypothetical protein
MVSHDGITIHLNVEQCFHITIYSVFTSVLVDSKEVRTLMYNTQSYWVLGLVHRLLF